MPCRHAEASNDFFCRNGEAAGKLVICSFLIMRVKIVVRLMASRRSIILRIELLNKRIIVRFPDRKLTVLLIRCFCTFRSEVDPASD